MKGAYCAARAPGRQGRRRQYNRNPGEIIRVGR